MKEEDTGDSNSLTWSSINNSKSRRSPKRSIRIDGDIFKSEGKVMYANERKDGDYDIGVNFINAPKESLNLLSQYLSQRE
jgi:hypothetical protein